MTVDATTPAAIPSTAPRAVGRIRHLLAFAWKVLLGVIFCLTPVTGLLVIGWTYRAMRRMVLRRWFRLSVLGGQETAYRDFALSNPYLGQSGAWPNWLIGPSSGAIRAGADGAAVGWRRRLLGAFGSLGENLRIGAQGWLNTLALTLPWGALWLLSWWGGWENSFNKGYEQAWVGPALGLLGTAGFMVVMTYLPMAQARQAVTGSWRAFWDVRVIRVLVKTRWLACLGLAAAFAIAGELLMALKAAPLAFPELVEGFDQMSDTELRDLGNAYVFWAGAVLFAAYVAVRLLAARLYAGAMLGAVAAGDLSLERLTWEEQQLLAQLGLSQTRARPPRHALVRAAGGLSRRLARIVATGLTLALWFAVVAQLYVAQFLNHAWISWLNHPLIQLPWQRVIPPLA